MASLNPGSVMTPAADFSVKSEWPLDVREVPIPAWDTGVFITELDNNDILPQKLEGLTDEKKAELAQNPELLLKVAREQAVAKQAKTRLEEGTWRGSQLALTKIYELIEKKFSSFMDTANFEPTVPPPHDPNRKKDYFVFTKPSDTDPFPPHLDLSANAPANKDVGPMQRSDLDTGVLFSKLRLAQLTTLLPTLVPKKFLDNAKLKMGQLDAELRLGSMGTPDRGQTLADVENYNKTQRAKTGWFARNDIFNLPNVGDLNDWYTDARFAQQQFTGTNPVTIELATDFWIKHFISAATDAADQRMKAKIQDLSSKDRKSLYMQDYSYFRKAAGVAPDASMYCEFEETIDSVGGKRNITSRRYGVASVCLFHLTEDGCLEPLAIVIDWRGSAAKSVTIYNRVDGQHSDEETDWAWRYAKSCVQCSDWVRHELTVHLTDTHLIEEAIIIATNRNINTSHMVFQLLYPHWQKTLSLNAAARNILIPYVIVPLAGMPDKNVYKFIRSEYESFDFKGGYVPENLRRRGFPPEKLDDKKYHNYVYARCIRDMWFRIREYVQTMLEIQYPNTADRDAKVAADKEIKAWCDEIHSADGANIKTFPSIATFDELVDAVTMCIHIASPQHTAVNYLQNYYQAFVVNKPPCLYTAPPTSLGDLKNFTEKDLVAALPMNRPHEWLLASHIPYLLSFKPGDKESLIIYAASKYHLYKFKEGDDNVRIRDAAAKLYGDLAATESQFRKYAKDADDSNEIMYEVLSPSWNAVSILI